MSETPNDQACQEPPCIHTVATGKHEWNTLHSVHQANDKHWFRQCPTCGWIDTEDLVKEAADKAFRAGQASCAPWMQHKKGCKAVIMFNAAGDDEWPTDVRIEDDKCSCGLDAHRTPAATSALTQADIGRKAEWEGRS